jgi:hypothetical protein
MPKTKNPLTLYPPYEWTLFDWLKNASALNFLWLLVTWNKYVCTGLLKAVFLGLILSFFTCGIVSSTYSYFYFGVLPTMSAWVICFINNPMGDTLFDGTGN